MQWKKLWASLSDSLQGTCTPCSCKLSWSTCAVWASHPSPRQGEVKHFVYSYIDHADLAQCNDPYRMKLDTAALTRAILTANVWRLPGFIRLDPSISDSTFESHWMFLIHCATEMLAQRE